MISVALAWGGLFQHTRAHYLHALASCPLTQILFITLMIMAVFAPSGLGCCLQVHMVASSLWEILQGKITHRSNKNNTFQTGFPKTSITSQYKHIICIDKGRQKSFIIIFKLRTAPKLSSGQLWMIPQNLYQDSVVVLLIWIQIY